MNYFKVTYYHTLYRREVTIITDEVRFDDDGYARFSHMGHKEAVQIQYVRKITGM